MGNPIAAAYKAYKEFQALKEADAKKSASKGYEIREPVRHETLGGTIKYSDVQEQVKEALKRDDSFLKTPSIDQTNEIVERYAKAFDAMRKAVGSGKLDAAGLASTSDLWVKTLKSQQVEQEAQMPKSQLQQSMLQQFNSFMTSFTTELVSKGIQYELGARSVSSGKLDCSGFVQNAYQAWFQAVGKRAESLGINTDMADALRGTSEAIIEQVSKLTGGYLKSSVAGIDKSVLKPGMLIGLDTGDHGWDEGRKLGIDHIVEVLQDAEGKLKIAQSSSSGGGVNLIDYGKWASQLKNATAYVVNPLQGITDKFTPTLGELQKFSAESGKILQQTKDQNEQLTAQLGYDSVSAKIAGIRRRYDKEQADLLEKMRTGAGPIDTLQSALGNSKSNEAIEIKIAQQKAYQDSLKETADLLQKVGDLSGDTGTIRSGREAASQKEHDVMARNINANYSDPDTKSRAQTLNDQKLTLELAQIRMSTTKDFAEYYDNFINNLNAKDKAYQSEVQSIYGNELSGYISISAQMVSVREKAYDEILAYAKQTGNAELAAFAQVNKEEEIARQLQNTQKYGTPDEAFNATISLEYKTYLSDESRARENAVGLAKDIKGLTDDIASSFGSTISEVVKGWATGTLDMKTIWSNLLSGLGNAFGSFAQKILKMWFDDLLTKDGLGDNGLQFELRFLAVWSRLSFRPGWRQFKRRRLFLRQHRLRRRLLGCPPLRPRWFLRRHLASGQLHPDFPDFLLDGRFRLPRLRHRRQRGRGGWPRGHYARCAALWRKLWGQGPATAAGVEANDRQRQPESGKFL